ncbi:MAG: adenine phosphoribosyltransferase [Gammaproteobacteria bacterium]|nr:adenine phosphoribosyltransferase [Gammaproteobacteria bacterium]
MTNPLHAWIKTYPDFPKPGILFYDIAPILEHPDHLKQTVEMLASTIDAWQPEVLVGIDSRGFLFATPVALSRGLGVVMIRKKGKLPGDVREASYALEYGEATLAVQRDRALAGKRVVLIDDLLATGGTLAAAETLLTQSGATVVGCVVLIELTDLKGRTRLTAPVKSLQTYAA